MQNFQLFLDMIDWNMVLVSRDLWFACSQRSSLKALRKRSGSNFFLFHSLDLFELCNGLDLPFFGITDRYSKLACLGGRWLCRSLSSHRIMPRVWTSSLCCEGLFVSQTSDPNLASMLKLRHLVTVKVCLHESLFGASRGPCMTL